MRGRRGPEFGDAKEKKAISFGGRSGGGRMNMPKKIRRSCSVGGGEGFIFKYLEPIDLKFAHAG